MENSVAAVLKADGGVAGTTFLFRKEEDFCYWFTCHHVISTLPKLSLGLNFNENEPPVVISADYVTEYSSPDKDVAVLRTSLEQHLQAFAALPMGDVHIPFNQTEDVTGIGFTPRNIKNFISGQCFSAKLTRGQEPQFFIHDEAATEGVRKLGNPWNIPLPKTRSLVFNLNSSTIQIEGGFSGSPICATTRDKNLLCVGMVNQANKLNRTSGTAISFAELFSSAGTAIPFYPYADCIILVLAAKRGEIDELANDSANIGASALIASYDNHRNRWRSFDNESDVETLLSKIRHRHTWQLATLYLDDLRELEGIIKYTPRAIFFIIDSCSIGVPALKNIIEEADNQFFRAAYLFPMCEFRFNGMQKLKLRAEQKAHMPRVFNSAWVVKRRSECVGLEEFTKNVVLMIEEAVNQSVLLSPDEIGQLLEQANIPLKGINKLPIINVEKQGRGY